MKLALKVDVDTYRGTREGVPRLLEILDRHGAGATFLFSLGPDHTGRAIGRAVRSHHGLRTMLYGTLLPAPDVGRRCAAVMRRVRDAGFEVGIHAWNAVAWQGRIAKADGQWTGWQMALAAQRFQEVFDEAPTVHGAPGWRMNVHAFRRTQSLGLRYASDTRGTHPFIPVVRAEIVACPQFPTTLPTLDEASAEALLERTQSDRRDHVFTLHAEWEGMKRAEAFERLLEGWKAQGYELVPIRRIVEETSLESLPLHSVIGAHVADGIAAHAMQGGAFLAAAPSPSS